MNSRIKLVALSCFLALAAIGTGCDRTVSKEEKVKVSSDGSVTSKETTVTQKADGTTVKQQETKQTTPARP